MRCKYKYIVRSSVGLSIISHACYKKPSLPIYEVEMESIAKTDSVAQIKEKRKTLKLKTPYCIL